MCDDIECLDGFTWFCDRGPILFADNELQQDYKIRIYKNT